MAHPPEDRDAVGPSFRLDIPLLTDSPEPYTYVASRVNTALAETAFDELQDEDSGVIPVIVDLTLSPMYLIARASLERDLGAATAAGRHMAINIFASRMMLAGTKLRTAEGLD